MDRHLVAGSERWSACGKMKEERDWGWISPVSLERRVGEVLELDMVVGLVCSGRVLGWVWLFYV
jgi:hypothetical protein